MLRRKIDRILSEGEGKQLAWLAGIALALFLVLVLLGSFWALGWTEILNLYLDPGSYPLEAKEGSQDALNIFSLLIAFGGILVLNALTISAFSNVFDNISEKYRKGERRYRLKGHILILGGGRQLLDMLKALRGTPEFAGREIVVMTSSDVETLRDQIETALDEAKFCKRLIWYRGERDNEGDLRSACSSAASRIYLIGEDGEPAHDSVSIGSISLLRSICEGSQGAPIPCFVTLEMHSSIDVLNYLPGEADSRLQVEIVNASDYMAEQLLVDTAFLPVPDEGQSLRIVIAGLGRMGRSIAGIAAQICHFPKGGRTVISFVDDGMQEKIDNFVANHQSLFDLSHYTYISPVGRTGYVPKNGYGDFLDVEWEFIDSPLASDLTRGLLTKWADDPAQKLVVVLCYEDASACISSALHLPKALYKAGIPVAVYQKAHPEVLEAARATGQFGSLTIFGEASEGSDALFLRRSLYGKRVNFLYDRKYGGASATPDEAWAPLSFAHKLSSIASANSIPIKLRTFGIEPTRSAIDALSEDVLKALSEVEHRRWMISVLMLGYSAAPAKERKDRSRFKELKNKEFIHLDIAPYDEIAEEADKDTIIVKNIPFIVNGEQIV